jgi:hypothetical protein
MMKQNNNDCVIDAFPINASRFKNCRAYEIDLDGKIDFFQDILPRLRAIKIEDNFACVGKELILTISPVSTDLLGELNLNEVEMSIENKKTLMSRFVVSEFSSPEYRNEKGKALVSRKPLTTQGFYSQYLKFTPKVLAIEGRFFLRPDPVTELKFDGSLADVLPTEIDYWLNKKVKMAGESRTGYLNTIHGQVSKTIDEAGNSVFEAWTKRRDESYEIRRVVDSMVEDMLTCEVSFGDYYQRGHGSKKVLSPLNAVTPIITYQTLPDELSTVFMQESHVELRERFNRSSEFVRCLPPGLVMDEVADSQLLGMKPLVFKNSQVCYGSAHQATSLDPLEVYRKLRRYGWYRNPEKSIRIGVIGTEGTPNWGQFVNEVSREMTGMQIQHNIVQLPNRVDDGERINRAKLAREFENIDVDVLMMLLNEFSEKKWLSIKRAGRMVDLNSQLITRPKLTQRGVSFNTALGLVSAAGGMPLGISGSLSGIQAWIGVDVWREGRKNIAAASVAFDSNGTHIGQVNTRPIEGERIDDSTFEELLHDLLDGLLDHNPDMSRNDANIGILRDGRVFESEEILSKVGSERGVKFVSISFVKRGQPRMGVRDQSSFSTLSQGSALVASNNWGFIQTSEKRQGRLSGAPTTKMVRLISGNVDFNSLIEDVFWLCKINASSTQQPGVPIPIHYAHKLAEQAGKGLAMKEGFHTDLGFL